MTFALAIAVWHVTKLRHGSARDVLAWIDFAETELSKPKPKLVWDGEGYIEVKP